MIGRIQEIKKLNELYNSNKSELVCVYGRRRVGKTFLIDQTFANQITFRHSGLSPIENNVPHIQLKQQLNFFYNSLILYGLTNEKKPNNWFDAFLLLEKLLISKKNGQRQLVFIDELPWLDTPKSSFITAFEGFWNGWACHQNDLMVIVCGSSTSWVMNNLINNYGGLYGRITYQIKLIEFTLKETEEFLHSKNILYSKYDIIQLHMIFGGIPYYLNYLQPGYSLSQNIDNIFFSKNAPLALEYNLLFNSLFKRPELCEQIIRLLCEQTQGITKKEICNQLHITNNGNFTNIINSLMDNDFIVSYRPFNSTVERFKCIDAFCLFYNHFIIHNTTNKYNYWSQNQNSNIITTWRGFAFEKFCFAHIELIKKALGISGIDITYAPIKYDNGQIDLVLKRNDNIINICELKFYNTDFNPSLNDFKKTNERIEYIKSIFPKKYSIQTTLITTFGISQNQYMNTYNNVITLEDLF